MAGWTIGCSTIFRVLLASFAVLLLSACAETTYLVNKTKELKDRGSPTAKGHYKVGKPYRIKGVWYYPKEDWDYVETGVASWYGPQFHGKDTANGEIFDQNAVSAAHRTLPLPSVVRVTNLENGRVIVVRVNDRGPFAHGRIIDMSRRGAQLLGFERQGTAKVLVEILENASRQVQAIAKGIGRKTGKTSTFDAPKPKAAPTTTVGVGTLAPPSGAKATAPKPAESEATAARRADSDRVSREGSRTQLVDSGETVSVDPSKITDGQLFVQAGAFRNKSNADRLSRKLVPLGNSHVQQAQVSGKTFYRVRIGPIASVSEADAVLDRTIRAGYPGSRIVVD